jgi:AmmeMemoRadiSam system protein B
LLGEIKMIRQPAVAGSFYPRNKSQLLNLIEACFEDAKLGPGKKPDKTKDYPRTGNIFGLVSPHAGFVYSGPIAAHGFLRQFEDGKPDYFVIIGPNHRNIGPGISVFPEGTWTTPLGDIKIAEDITTKIIEQPHFRADTAAHMLEHSIEIQIPFIQYLYGDKIPIVPICIKDQSLESSLRIGKTLAKTLNDDDYCIIASTDLTHFESANSASEKDQFVIQKIKQMDPEGLVKIVEDRRITMCGPGSVASVLFTAKNSGMKNVEILRYANSGDVSGDKNHVVAYLSALIMK